MEYLDNGVVRVGADLDLGGAITYLADARTRENIINNYDWGRQIQLSFYSGPVPYEPNGQKPHERWTFIGWNPIQVGDVAGNRSKTIEFSKKGGSQLYIRSIPMHWPLDNVPGECTFETWIALEDNIVHLRGRLNNNRTGDTTQYPARGQELPAVYTNGSYWRLVTYTGERPFTGDALTTIPTANGVAFPWKKWQATEHWAALVRDDGWGLGVYNPDSFSFTGGFAGKTGSGGSADAPTGYIAPLQREIIDHNIQYEFTCAFVVGPVEWIRNYATYASRRPAPPSYVFDSDRRHWTYHNARDAGWPIRGELDVTPEPKPDPQLVGPADFWQAADAPRLYVRAAWTGQPARAQVFWNTSEPSGSQTGSRRKPFGGPVEFDWIADGQFHTYEIDLSASPEYRGAITGLRLDPVAAGRPGDRLRVKSIGFTKLEDQ